MSHVGLLGYGRFGAALASLLTEAGHPVVAFDPHGSGPLGAVTRAENVGEAVTGAEVVVVATPVPVMAQVLATARPHLTGAQLVLDVGSVKVRPEEALASALGGDIPWVATHPLFGPVSLARAERPLRVVVCPNRWHPSAPARAHALYTSIGCEVLVQDAHTHDRAMAETHALAFFVAKGMLDAGIGLDVPYAPPSFQAIARTVETVRADAGHLFAAIQRQNPYAQEARRRLLDALGAVDAMLSSVQVDPVGPTLPPGALANEDRLQIPEVAGTPSPALTEARQHIDELDRELVGLLARRGALARRAAAAKAELGRAVTDPGREQALLEERRRWAEGHGLDGDSMEDVFRAILRFSRRLQAK